MVNLGSGGNKYIVQFSIGGTGKRDLQEIGGLFNKVNKSMGLSNAYHMERIFDRIEGFGETMMGWGEEAFKGLYDGFDKLITQGALLEQQILALEATGKGKQEAIGMVSDMIKLSSELPVTEANATNILTGLAALQIDAFDRIGASYDKLAKQGKTLPDLGKTLGMDRMAAEGEKNVSVITDILAATKQIGTGSETNSIQQMMVFLGGSMPKGYKAFGYMAADVRALAKQTKDASARMQGLFDILAKHHALGVSSAAMETWSGLMTSFKGMGTRFVMSVMEPGKTEGILGAITRVFKDLYNKVIPFFDESTESGKAFLKTIRELGLWIVSKVKPAIESFGNAVKGMMTWMGKHPMLTKFAFTLGVVAAASLVAVGGMIALAASIAAVTVSLSILESFLVPLLPLFGTVAAAIGLVAAAYELYEANFAGVKSTVDNVIVLFTALSEAYDNWAGETTKISKETGDKLQKAGMLGIFLDFIGFMREAEVTWKGFMSKMQTEGPGILDRLESSFTKISMAVGRVWDAVSEVLIILGLIPDTTEDTFDQATSNGEGFADTLLSIGDRIADITTLIADVVDAIVPSIQNMIMVLTPVLSLFREIWNVANLVLDVIRSIVAVVQSISGGVVGGMIALVRSVNGDSKGAQEALNTTGKAIGDIWGPIAKSFEDDAKGFWNALGSGEAAARVVDDYDNGRKPIHGHHPYARLPGSDESPLYSPSIIPQQTPYSWMTGEAGPGAAPPEARNPYARLPKLQAPPVNLKQTINVNMDGRQVSQHVIEKTIQQDESAGNFGVSM